MFYAVLWNVMIDTIKTELRNYNFEAIHNENMSARAGFSDVTGCSHEFLISLFLF